MIDSLVRLGLSRSNKCITLLLNVAPSCGHVPTVGNYPACVVYPGTAEKPTELQIVPKCGEIATSAIDIFDLVSSSRMAFKLRGYRCAHSMQHASFRSTP